MVPFVTTEPRERRVGLKRSELGVRVREHAETTFGKLRDAAPISVSGLAIAGEDRHVADWFNFLNRQDIWQWL